jgi:predicted dehydrogenase
MDNHSPVKVGLIGLGNMGRNHLRVLSMLKQVDLAFIYDLDIERAEELAKTHNTKALTDINDAFNSDIDALVISTPTSTHAQYLEQAIGKIPNIFVEKPMTETLEEAEKISVLAKEHGTNIQIGFIERFNPAVQQLNQVLQKSSNVINVDFTRTNKLSSRITDVDVISDLMIHDIDLAIHLNGSVKNVSAHGSIDNNLINFASAILTHDNGHFSRIQASRITEKKMRKIEATCEDVFIDCELLRKEIIVTSQSRIKQDDGRPYTISAVQEAIEVRPQEALLLQHQSFIASCQGVKNPTNPNITDGLESLKICDMIQKEIYAC